MRSKQAALTILGCGLPLLAACGPAATSSTGGAPSSPQSQSVVATPPAATSAAATPPTSAAPASSATAVNFPMPNLVGQVLQDAQGALHADGVFYSRSHDLRGVRHQVLDRD